MLDVRRGFITKDCSCDSSVACSAVRARFRHPDFLGRCSRECTAFQGSLVYCRPLWDPQRTVADPFGAPLLLASQKMTMPGPWWEGNVCSGLGPVGCPESLSSFFFDSAELRLPGCEKDTTGVRAGTVNSSRGVRPPPFGRDSEHVDPLADASAPPPLDVTVASVFAPCFANLKVLDVDSVQRRTVGG